MQHTSLSELSYPIFLYAGIVFFIIHLLIYGLGLDKSYFGLVLAYVGYYKIGLNTLIFVLLWLGLILEGINLGKTVYEKYLKGTDSNNSKKDK